MTGRFRIGSGYDVHTLQEGETLYLGGILIPHTKGTVGHSDGDVLIHAICDALLGSVALRDIGYHFPDTDPSLKGVDSKQLLAQVMTMLRAKGFEIGNIDTTIAAQKPRLKEHIPAMQEKLAEVMNIPVNDISIKATTTEKLGFEGREEGISAYATALVFSIL